MSQSPLILSELINQLGMRRAIAADAYKHYKKLKLLEDQAREDLYDALHTAGLDSIKGKEFTASIAKTPTIIIQHEAAVIDWLRNTPDIEEDLYIGVKSTQFQTLAKSILKGTGEVIPGTDLQVRESLAIRSNKPTKKE